LKIGVDEDLLGVGPGGQETVGVPTGYYGNSSGHECSGYENLYHGILPYRLRMGA